MGFGREGTGNVVGRTVGLRPDGRDPAINVDDRSEGRTRCGNVPDAPVGVAPVAGSIGPDAVAGADRPTDGLCRTTGAAGGHPPDDRMGRPARGQAVTGRADPDGDPAGAGGMSRRSATVLTTPPATLSDTWHRARSDPDLTVRSQAEDALFRHYLPLAVDLADRWALHNGDPAGARQIAEIALARTILDWRHDDCSRFERFARLVIERSLHGSATDGPARPRTEFGEGLR